MQGGPTAQTAVLSNHERADTVGGVARGVDALELDSGHSPFLTRPAELADALHQVST
jgi:hypothetical protein